MANENTTKGDHVMNKQTKEALKMAIEVLEYRNGWKNKSEKALQACKEALEQPEFDYNTAFSHGYEAHKAEQQEQEPIAYIQFYSEDANNEDGRIEGIDVSPYPKLNYFPVYSHPANQLSDDELHKVFDDIVAGCYGDDDFWIKFARAIEAKIRGE